MPRVFRIYSQTDTALLELVSLDAEYQRISFSKTNALNLAIEYLFLEAYKIWENFLEDIFISYSRYNDPISGKRPYPFLQPKTEQHSLELLKLEKGYLDWTSPDNVIKRAEICFRNHAIITQPMKNAMSDLRQAKILRNYIAHASKESFRQFQNLSRNLIGKRVKRSGVLLNSPSTDGINNYNVYFIELFRDLVKDISN